MHPLLVHMPIGAWTTAAVLDEIDARRACGSGRPGFGDAVQTAVGLGVAGGAVAAVAGLADWQYTHDNARRVGLVHGALNAVALGVYGWSWWERRHGRPRRAQRAGRLGYPIVLVSQYLGGTLVYRHNVGTDHSDKQLDPRQFVPVLALEQLAEDTPYLVRVDDVDVVLVRVDGRVHALGERCAHLGGPMDQGWVYQGTLVCPWHGSRFDLATGEDRKGPATGCVRASASCARRG